LEKTIPNASGLEASGEAQAAILPRAKTVSHRVRQTETAPGNLQNRDRDLLGLLAIPDKRRCERR
jgi:hypothetical protein